MVSSLPVFAHHLFLAFAVLLLLLSLGCEIGPLENLVLFGLESEGEGTFRIPSRSDRLLRQMVVATFA